MRRSASRCNRRPWPGNPRRSSGRAGLRPSRRRTKTGADGALARARQRDADVGVFGFAGAVDDAAHHRDVEGFRRPDTCSRHFGMLTSRMWSWMVLGELLEHGRRGSAAAARAGGDDRHKLRGSPSPASSSWATTEPRGCGRLRAPVSARLGWCRRCPACKRMPMEADGGNDALGSPCPLPSGPDAARSRSAAPDRQ
jgi:hypothetical protein